MTYSPLPDGCTATRWTGDQKRCRWCDAELPSRRRTWCSGDTNRFPIEGCAWVGVAHHAWKWASELAKTEARKLGHACEVCREQGVPVVAKPELIPAGEHRLNAEHFLRHPCGEGPVQVRLAEGQWWSPEDPPFARSPRWGTVIAPYPARWAKLIGGDFEVNHRTPRRGAGYGAWSCAHHLEGLQVLCRYHHGIVTGMQKRARRDGLSDVDLWPPPPIPEPERAEQLAMA